MTKKRISEKDIKLLYAISGATCAKCRRSIIIEKSDGSRYHISEIAHIRGKGKKALRYDLRLTSEEINDESNLIVLCPNCHTIIDKNEKDFPVEKILEIKNEHEEWVLSWSHGETNPDEIIRLMPDSNAVPKEVTLLLINLRNILDPRNQTYSNGGELKNAISPIISRISQLLNIRHISVKIDDLATELVNWRPVTGTDPARADFYEELLNLIDELQRLYDIEIRLTKNEAFRVWLNRLLGSSRYSSEEVLEKLINARRMPQEILDLVNIDILNSALTFFIAIQYIEPDKQTYYLIKKLLCSPYIANEELQKCIELCFKIIDGDDEGILAVPLIAMIEYPELKQEFRKAALKQIVDSGVDSVNFSRIGNKGLAAALDLPEPFKKHILLGALNSDDRSITIDTVRHIDITDRKTQALVDKHIMKWDPNTGEYALIRLKEVKYEGLFDRLFTVARDHKEISLRRTAIRKIGEWGEWEHQSRLIKCKELEHDEEIIIIIEGAINAIAQRMGPGFALLDWR